ncbi:MAG: phosphoenolpyruvate carboxykinase (ATP), partial [Rhodospirillaceae bacterium]|nr:phosphoenolpyruvate carboxykinase (ATP) [Rhodospirillaceae bacterium]
MAQTGAVASRFGLDKQGIRTSGTEFWNLNVPELYEQALQRKEARLAHGGPLVAVTGEHTGRSPNDQFTVRDAETEDTVAW